MKALRRLLAPVTALGLAAGLVTLVHAPATAATDVSTRVVVDSIQKIQRYNRTIRVSGSSQGQDPADGQWKTLPTGTAELQRKLAGTSAWRAVQRDTTPASFAFNVRAVQNASYRVVYSGGSYNGYVFAPATSVSRWLLVRRNLNDRLVRSGGKFFVKGDINPGGGLYVYVQRRTCGTCAWKGWKRVRSGGLGKFSVRVQPPKRGTHYYRAYVKANAKFTRSPSNYSYRTYRY